MPIPPVDRQDAYPTLTWTDETVLIDDTTHIDFACGTGVSPVSAPVSAWNICETRDGSDQTTYQYVWGTKYTDELIMIEKNLGVTVGNDVDADTLSAAEAAQPALSAARDDEGRHRIGQSAEDVSHIRRLALNLLCRNKPCKLGVKAKWLKACPEEQFLLDIPAPED